MTGTRSLARRPTLVGLALLLLTGAAPAPGTPGEQVHETRPAAPDMRLEIDDIVVGSVHISGWDREEMEVTGRLGRDVTELTIEGDRDGYRISADWEDWGEDWSDWDDTGRQRDRDRHRDVDVDLEIRVPRAASLRVETVTAPVSIDGVDGEVDLETVTGSLDYQGGTDSVSLATVTGRIRAAGGRIARGQFESVQGDISWSGSFARGAEVSFETVGGNVELALPDDASASFDVETTMGDIDTDFEVQAERVNRWVNSQELHFSIGSGGARVSIETLQGRVRLRRQ